MSKQTLKEERENSPEVVLIGWGQIKTIVKLDELVLEHGTIFITNPKGLPLKVTRAELK